MIFLSCCLFAVIFMCWPVKWTAATLYHSAVTVLAEQQNTRLTRYLLRTAVHTVFARFSFHLCVSGPFYCWFTASRLSAFRKSSPPLTSFVSSWPVSSPVLFLFVFLQCSLLIVVWKTSSWDLVELSKQMAQNCRKAVTPHRSGPTLLILPNSPEELRHPPPLAGSLFMITTELLILQAITIFHQTCEVIKSLT